MASEKYLQLSELSDTDLQTEMETTVTQYRRLKFDHTIKGLENPIGLRDVRRDIARLKTEMRRREMTNLSEDQVAGRSKLRARRSGRK